MSYILEALKKAQAERQLGNAPTIHAPAPDYTAPAARAGRHPVLVGAVAGTLVVALGALFLLRPPASAPALQVASTPAPARPAAAPAVVPASAPESAPDAAPDAAAAAAGAPAAAPAAADPPPAPRKPSAPPAAAKPAPPPARPAPKSTPTSAPKPAAPADKAAPVPPTAPAEAVPDAPRPVLVAAAPAAPSAEDGIGPLQSLPESVQREIPKVSFGGYIYSPNPAERLLLVDKMLRREGEEVAPGLVLERLLPKAAIMNYRGMRYRVGY